MHSSHNNDASPAQLVFGRDMILNIKHAANWDIINDETQKDYAQP
jgi:hypothetical protein